MAEPVEAAAVVGREMHEPYVESQDGNGSGQSMRNRVPLFNEDDRTIPAYIRRLDDD